MAKSFRELGKKTDELIEKGREIEQKVQGCQSRVVAQTSRVATARRNLALASEMDSEGNPRGDIIAAQAELRIAENILASHQRALLAAQNEAKMNQQEKNSQIQEIEKHNQTTKANLDKLSSLDSLAHGGNSAGLREGMVERYNEAEESRIALLKSMGIDASPEILSITVSGREQSASINLVDMSSRQFETVGTSEKKDNNSQLSIAAPVGGGLNTVPIPQEIFPVSEITIPQKDQDDWEKIASLIKEKQQDPTVDDPYQALIMECIEEYGHKVNTILAANGLSNEHMKQELESLKNSIMIAVTMSQSQAEQQFNEENQKAKRMSAEEKLERGKKYIDNMMEVYRENLIDRGVTCREALDVEVSKLRSYYEGELWKDVDGLPNGLYEDPDYNSLIENVQNSRPAIANVLPGENMSFREADTGHVNPNIGKGYGYSINCQSCVVTFEARERGYDVSVLPNTKGSVLETLSRETNLAWVDPKTGKHPEYIYDETRRTPEEYLEYIDKVVKPGNRYTIQFAWKGTRYGHIVNLDRNEAGLLRIKDNQREKFEPNEYIGDIAVLRYLSKMKYEERPLFGEPKPCVPQLLRIDNMDFDMNIVNHIMEGASNT